MGRRALGVLGAWATAVLVNRSLRRVRGGSMVPTLHEGDLVLTLPVRSPARGEVVLVRDPRAPTGPAHTQVKRVIGLPGETVELRDGVLRIDGRPHREAHEHGRGPDGQLQVPPGHVAVLGDARGASTDSRAYGPVPLELVERRVPAALQPRPRWLRSVPTPLGPAPGSTNREHRGTTSDQDGGIPDRGPR